MIDDQKLVEFADFAKHLGETFVFSVEGVDTQVEGVLSKAEVSKSATVPDAKREPFGLEFKFPAGANIGQCLFLVKTSDGKEFPPMFLVPCFEDEAGWYMHSAFN